MEPPLLFDLRGKSVYVAGHGGMAGAAIMRRLESEGCEILTADRAELDLTDQTQTEDWLQRKRPAAIFLAAGRVGGIHANATFPADFLADNLAIALNVMRAAVAAEVEKLLYLGSSCIFPRNARQPMDDDLLLTGPLEPTNEWYAIAKIAGIKLVQAYRRQFGSDFISVTPTNLYGRGDNYHPENSHVPAALIRRFHDAKIRGAARVSVWGTGTPRREFLAADDLGDACVFVMKHYSGEHILNIGTGEEVSIKKFSQLVADVVGYRGEITFDTSRPDGTPRKLLDVSRLATLGWVSTTPLGEGLKAAYADFLKSARCLRER
ncbi:MAG: GDP-L-fucose synthase [Pseudolabrys sp.]|nr:GDP-L-fucose synthase [Pseudolabrys sp.]MDP2295760.1 GDP-L-fucose synthase [Pseudolabrys sp.]